MRTIYKTRSILFGVLALLPFVNYSQTQVAVIQSPSLWGNPVFLSLFGIALFLLIVIIVLADAVKGTARYSKENDRSVKNKTLGIVALLMLSSSYSVMAQS